MIFQSAQEFLRGLVKMQILIHQVWARDLWFCVSDKLSGEANAAGPALTEEQGTLRPRILHWHKEEVWGRKGQETLSHSSHPKNSMQKLDAMKRSRNTDNAPILDTQGPPKTESGPEEHRAPPPQLQLCTEQWGGQSTTRRGAGGGHGQRFPQWNECGGSAESWGWSLHVRKTFWYTRPC